MHRTFKYRLRPTDSQRKKLEWTLDRCRDLYNAGLEDRILAYRHGHNRSYVEQSRELPGVKEVRPEYSEISAYVSRNVLVRLDRAYKAFFRRCKSGETPGYPRFKGRDRYDSFTYDQPDPSGKKDRGISGVRLDGDRLYVAKIGAIKTVVHRPLEGRPLLCTLRRDGTHWYACLTTEIDRAPAPPKTDGRDIGIDVGISSYYTDDTGGTAQNPRYARASADTVARLQQSLARCRRGSNNRKKVKSRLGRATRKVYDQRRDHLHKLSRSLVDSCRSIAVEDLDVREILINRKGKNKTGLHRSIADAAWSMFFGYLSYKAEDAGTVVYKVDPKNTTQACSMCGALPERRKELWDRVYICTRCGYTANRDLNAARNILKKGKGESPGQYGLELPILHVDSSDNA